MWNLWGRKLLKKSIIWPLGWDLLSNGWPDFTLFPPNAGCDRGRKTCANLNESGFITWVLIWNMPLKFATDAEISQIDYIISRVNNWLENINFLAKRLFDETRDPLPNGLCLCCKWCWWGQTRGGQDGLRTEEAPVPRLPGCKTAKLHSLHTLHTLYCTLVQKFTALHCSHFVAMQNCIHCTVSL